LLQLSLISLDILLQLSLTSFKLLDDLVYDERDNFY
jgi:hypothetical protein